MKTSNKLLIVLFFFVVITLVLFNVLLNVQLKAGNLSSEYQKTTRSTVTMKPFQHVVYDGRQYLHQSRSSQSWVSRTIHLSVGDRNKHELEIPSNFEPILRYHYQGDTLFIGFSSEDGAFGRADYIPDGSIPLRLFAPALSSVASVGGIMNVDRIRQQEPLALHLANSANFMLLGLDIPVLQLHADSNAQVMVVDNSHVDTLALTMGKSTGITFVTPNNIKNILPVQLDSTARIRVDGKAADMKTYLQKTQ
ncbi:hypothetical protein GFS24_27285 [Chitinophaga sp. SYP-B3965]|uniref:hypothetical protein n=1 Tax=Chitinophaga sp. SYP-B3965 TaxID=2663120 RepID=UPI0012997A18|nr:hypothetical protein [Chitinophaga sp. SYP-B3965]MRG48844.1 hypothetical protein [Chitinophaga sp. SYP-B3965]